VKAIGIFWARYYIDAYGHCPVSKLRILKIEKSLMELMLSVILRWMQSKLKFKELKSF